MVFIGLGVTKELIKSLSNKNGSKCSLFCLCLFLFYKPIFLKRLLVALTPAADSANNPFSFSFKLISTILSIPFLPKITGTPIVKSFKGYSPSNKAEHGNIFC